ncbi:hypothetical protein VTK73DRAFT_5838 [Phialemonium thermophilum]|uniref:Uncharacterized protein n=1 Tax=Phialemonium thermophilum TaxID=223376 RepID=A0ABR3V0M0_9PEZI
MYETRRNVSRSRYHTSAAVGCNLRQICNEGKRQDTKTPWPANHQTSKPNRQGRRSPRLMRYFLSFPLLSLPLLSLRTTPSHGDANHGDEKKRRGRRGHQRGSCRVPDELHHLVPLVRLGLVRLVHVQLPEPVAAAAGLHVVQPLKSKSWPGKFHVASIRSRSTPSSPWGYSEML